MNRNERERLTRQENTLMELGFTREESDSLRRISRTLQRWHELECGTDNGMIERDDATGKPFWVSYTRRYLGANDARMRTPMADRETGSLRRLARIISARNQRIGSFVDSYIQSDPRGAALYILRPGDVPPGLKAESCYTRGICVY